MPAFYTPMTKQNSTERIYKTTLINNTDVQQSEALSEVIVAVFENGYFNNATDVQNAVTSGAVTLNQYVILDGLGTRKVDTAENIIKDYL